MVLEKELIVIHLDAQAAEADYLHTGLILNIGDPKAHLPVEHSKKATQTPTRPHLPTVPPRMVSNHQSVRVIPMQTTTDLSTEPVGSSFVYTARLAHDLLLGSPTVRVTSRYREAQIFTWLQRIQTQHQKLNTLPSKLPSYLFWTVLNQLETFVD